MTPRSRPETVVRRTLWLGGLFVVLGGIFGMHGLDNHGTGPSVDSAVHAAVSDTAGAVGHGHVMDTAHRASPAAIAAAAATGGIGMDMGAVGMCVAVLGLGLIALLLRLWASCRRPLMRLMARPVHASGVRGRDRDPPSLIHLSIQRC